MVITGLVIAHDTLLDAFRSRFQCNMDSAVRARLRRQHAKLNPGQGCTRIPASCICQKIRCFFFKHGPIRAKPLLLIGYGPVQQHFDIFFGQCMQLKNNRTRKQRPIYLKVRIFRRCANEHDRPVFHKRQKVILLALVKPVDFVYKQNRLFSVHALIVPGFCNDLLHILFPGRSCIQLQELCTGRIGNDLCQCRLAGSRRPVKNNRTQLIRHNGAVQQPVLSDNMLLACDLLKRRRAHP